MYTPGAPPHHPSHHQWPPPHTVLPLSRLRADTRYSALAFSIASALFLPWFLLYVIAGDRVLPPSVYHTLDATGLNVAGLGLPSG